MKGARWDGHEVISRRSARQGVQGIRCGRRRVAASCGGERCTPDRAERRRQNDFLSIYSPSSCTDFRPRSSITAGTSRGRIRRHCPPRHRAVVPDLRSLSAPDGARECARGAAAQPGTSYLFLAFGKELWRASTIGRCSYWPKSPWNSGAAHSPRICPTTQRALELATTLRSSRGVCCWTNPLRHGATRTCRVVTPAHQAVCGRPYRAHGRAQHECGLVHRRYHLRAAAGQGDRRGLLAEVSKNPQVSKPISGTSSTALTGTG